MNLQFKIFIVIWIVVMAATIVSLAITKHIDLGDYLIGLLLCVNTLLTISGK